MAGGGTQQPQQTTTTQLSPQANALFAAAYPNIANFAANPPARYPGSTVAGFTPLQEQAQQGTLTAAEAANQLATQFGLGLGSAAERFAAGPNLPGFQAEQLPGMQSIFSEPGLWDARLNPQLQEAMNAATRPLYENLQEQVLPNIRHTAIAQGPFGGSRQQIAEGLAAGRTQRAAGDVNARMAQEAYQANLAATNARYINYINALNQRYGTNVGAGTAYRGQDITAQGQYNDQLLRALGLIPQAQAAQFVGPGAVAGVGAQQQAMNQAQLNDQINAYYYNQLAPYMASRDIVSLIQSFPGATNVSTANVPQGNKLLGAAGGALAGAGTGAMLGSVVPVIGPLAGAGIGAGVGALPFAFS